MKEARTDAGTIVVGWLVKVALALAIFGLVAFNALAIGSAHLSTSDDANSAASAAAADFQNSHNAASAESAAEQAITNPSEKIVPNSVVIAQDGTVTLSVQRTITTVLMESIGPLKKYTVIRVTGEGTPPTS